MVVDMPLDNRAVDQIAAEAASLALSGRSKTSQPPETI
jgi:hypothetical protein